VGVDAVDGVPVPHSSHWRFRRPCLQWPVPHSLHSRLCRPWVQLPVPPHSSHRRFRRPCLQWPVPHSLRSCFCRPCVGAVAGAAVFAPVLPPTADAVAGAAVFAPLLRLTVLAEAFVPCILQHLVRRPQHHLVFPFIWIFLSALNMAAGVWHIYLTSLTGLGRCHFYIRMAIGGCKSQHLQLSSRDAVINPAHAQLVTNASQPVDMNGSRSTTASSPLTHLTLRCVAASDC
jgi:hypothetical protein